LKTAEEKAFNLAVTSYLDMSISAT